METLFPKNTPSSGEQDDTDETFYNIKDNGTITIVSGILALISFFVILYFLFRIRKSTGTKFIDIFAGLEIKIILFAVFIFLIS